MKYILLLLPLLLLSCEAAKDNPPIERAKMDQLILDLHMAESYGSLTRDSARVVTMKNFDSLAAYHKDILAHHNLTPEQFSNVVAWYRDHSQELDSVYGRIIPRMSELEAKYVK